MDLHVPQVREDINVNILTYQRYVSLKHSNKELSVKFSTFKTEKDS